MKNNQSILFTCAGFGGGIGKMIRYVSSICATEFSEVYLLHRGRESKNDYVPHGVYDLEIPVDFTSNSFLWRLKHIRKIRSEIKRISPTVVCCFGSEQAVMIALALMGNTDVKLIQCDRGDPYTLPIVWRILSKWAFRRADHCVFQLQKQGEWYGANIMKRSTIIPNAFIPTGEVKPYEGERNKTIVSVGRFSPEKRYEVLIKAFQLVHAIHPEYKLILYGEGPSREIYSQMIKDYSLSDFVEMPGYVNDSMNAIRKEGIFVLSSKYEGIPNSLIEAMAVGVPSVSTDCSPGGPDFLTDHGHRGLIIPIDDVKAMCSAICKIIENPEFALELSHKSQEIISLLDKKAISKKWIETIKLVAGGTI